MAAIRNILVPLDGSVLAEQAIPLAVGIAAQHKATVHLVTVDIPQPAAYMAGIPAYQVMEYEASGLELARKRAQAGSGPTPPIVTALIRGPVTEALLGYAADNQVDLIAITTRGHPALIRKWIGDIEDDIVHCAPVPVLLDRPRDEEPGRRELRTIERVLVALNGSRAAEAILEYAVAVGGRKARYELMQVADTPGALPVEVIDLPLNDQDRGTLAYLGKLADGLRKKGFHASPRLVAGDGAPWGISDYASRSRADLIAMTTRGHGGRAGTLVGRVAESVVRTAHVPVLLLGPGGAGGGEHGRR